MFPLEKESYLINKGTLRINPLFLRLRRKTNTSTLPPGAAVGGEKRMYEMYAAPVGLQEHDMASSLKVLRGDQTLSTADSIYYYGQGAQINSHKQWGYDDDYVMRVSSESYSVDGQGQGAQQVHPHHGRQSAHAEYLESQVGSNRLSQHAMQSWDTVRLMDKKDRDRERERDASTTQAVSSLAFLYGATASHTLPASSSAASALGSSSDGNRSPDSDDPSEAATDNSQSSGSLCGSKGGDRESVSTISLSSAESQHKRNCHTHHGHHAQHNHHSNNAQWQGGGGYNHDPSGPLDPRKPPYQHYERDGYSSIYPAYLPQSRPHSSHQPGFRPPAPQQLGGHIQAQTQAQMMHARYLNYQQNVRQGQGREAVPKVAPIVIPATHFPSHSKSQPVIATLMDDHAHWAAKPLIVKNLSVVSTGDRERELSHRQAGGPECSDSMEGDRDNSLSFARTKGTVMPLLVGQAHTASRAEKDREDKYIVLMPHAPPLVSGPGGSDSAVPGRFPVERVSGSKSKHCDDSDSESMPQYSSRLASPGSALVPSSSDRSRCEAEEEEPACGNLVLDEPLGDATHALLSFCMQRNPWMYSPSSSSPPKEEASSFVGSGDGVQGLGPGPSALYKDVLSCLSDTPLLREELESYSEALYPSPFPPGARGHRRRSNPSSSAPSSASAQRKSQESNRREAQSLSKRSMECDESSSDENERERETSEGDLTDDSQDSDEQLSEQARSLSYCHSMTRKRDAVEEMRAFTTFASLRMQEVCDLVCEQEQRREKRREQDRDCGLNHWAMDRDGTSRDISASAAAAAFVKALETCTQTWWAYANLYK